MTRHSLPLATRALLFAVCLAFLAGSAGAAANWQSNGFVVEPQNVPKLVAAIDEFMATDLGKEMPGTMTLMASVIDGGDPATHSIITSMESMAAREAWATKLEGDAGWTKLVDTFVTHSQLGSNARMIFQKSWGEGGDGDVVWHLYALTLTDAEAYAAELDKLMASETGAKFPGSLWLSSVAAAGMGGVTHVLSVGYQSEAEAEAWNATMLPSADWAAFSDATDTMSTLDGSFVLRALKTWGTPTPTP